MYQGAVAVDTVVETDTAAAEAEVSLLQGERIFSSVGVVVVVSSLGISSLTSYEIWAN